MIPRVRAFKRCVPVACLLICITCVIPFSAIVQKVTGDTVLDYLTPRLFAPLGIEGVDWETDPQGINTGGWGLRVKTEDMAKFGQLFLQKGRWQGKQILPAAWIEEASSLKIIQNPNASDAQKASNNWLQGYAWSNETTLVLTLRYIESPHTETMRCRFEGEQVRVECEDLFHLGDNKTVLKGRVQ